MKSSFKVFLYVFSLLSLLFFSVSVLESSSPNLNHVSSDFLAQLKPRMPKNFYTWVSKKVRPEFVEQTKKNMDELEKAVLHFEELLYVQQDDIRNRIKLIYAPLCAYVEQHVKKSDGAQASDLDVLHKKINQFKKQITTLAQTKQQRTQEQTLMLSVSKKLVQRLQRLVPRFEHVGNKWQRFIKKNKIILGTGLSLAAIVVSLLAISRFKRRRELKKDRELERINTERIEALGTFTGSELGSACTYMNQYLSAIKVSPEFEHVPELRLKDIDDVAFKALGYFPYEQMFEILSTLDVKYSRQFYREIRPFYREFLLPLIYTTEFQYFWVVSRLHSRILGNVASCVLPHMSPLHTELREKPAFKRIAARIQSVKGIAERNLKIKKILRLYLDNILNPSHKSDNVRQIEQLKAEIVAFSKKYKKLGDEVKSELLKLKPFFDTLREQMEPFRDIWEKERCPICLESDLLRPTMMVYGCCGLKNYACIVCDYANLYQSDPCPFCRTEPRVIQFCAGPPTFNAMDTLYRYFYDEVERSGRNFVETPGFMPNGKLYRKE